jgi:hypothetical protein
MTVDRVRATLRERIARRQDRRAATARRVDGVRTLLGRTATRPAPGTSRARTPRGV